MKKKFPFVAVLILINACSFAQARKDLKPIKQSNIDRFSSNSGVTYKKEIIRIDQLPSTLLFEVVRITDLQTDSSEIGLRISGTPPNSIYLSAFLDSDEIDGFLKSVNYMISEVASHNPNGNGVEYDYSARSGFEFSTFNTSRFFGSSKKWNIAFELNDGLPNELIFLEVASLPYIKGAILHSINKIKELK